MIRWFSPSQLFVAQGPVRASQYATVGIALMLVKYFVEAVVVYSTSGQVFPPWDFVSPFLSSREQYLRVAGNWLGWFWVFWTIPFLWICIALSIRRCIDARVTPWAGMLMLVPFVNIAAMLFFASIPSQSRNLTDEKDNIDREPNPYQLPSQDFSIPPIDDLPAGPPTLGALGVAMGVGVAYLLFTILFNVYILDSYGSAMFMGGPIVTCAAGSFWLNRKCRASIALTLGHSLLILVACCVALLFIGLEGAVCIVMALPLFAPLALFGAIIGYVIAAAGNENEDSRGLYGCLTVLPLLAIIESQLPNDTIFEVQSFVEIDASPDEVWDTVIAFPRIDKEPEALFRMGVAYPIQARIEGTGVGAVRYCEFTTGAFVEPITTWDRPSRLGFDVTEQPDAMAELSPYSNLHPPHLDGGFTSVRGEFRLVALANGRTRLEGSTWYRLQFGPTWYWKQWTDDIVHRIHRRVLDHIREVSETERPRNFTRYSK